MKPISIQFPADLFIELSGRLNGDPTDLIEALARRHLAKINEVTLDTKTFERVTTKDSVDGNPSGGLEWSPLWLPNGTDLRMRYRQRTYLGKVRFDAIHYADLEYHSVSQWVRHVARGTARNAWHDVWVKFADSDEFVYADALRQVPRTGIPVNGESPDQRIARLSALAQANLDERDGNEE